MKHLSNYINESIQVNENSVLDQVDWNDYGSMEEGMNRFLRKIENKIHAFCSRKFDGEEVKILEEIYGIMIHLAQDMVYAQNDADDPDDGESLQNRFGTWTNLKDIQDTSDYEYIIELTSEELNMDEEEATRYVEKAVENFDDLVKMATGSYWW